MVVIFGHRKAAALFSFGGCVLPVTAMVFTFGAKSKRLDTMEQVKRAAREIADKHGVKSEEDIADLKKRLKSFQNEIKSVKADWVK